MPSEQAVRSAYDAIRTAAADRNLAAWLRTQGFDSDQAAAIRGLPEVELAGGPGDSGVTLVLNMVRQAGPRSPSS